MREEVMSAINYFACRHQVMLPQNQQFSSRSSCFHKTRQVSNTLQTATSFARTTFIICISYIYLFIHDLHFNQALPRVLNSNARSLSVSANNPESSNYLLMVILSRRDDHFLRGYPSGVGINLWSWTLLLSSTSRKKFPMVAKDLHGIGHDLLRYLQIDI